MSCRPIRNFIILSLLALGVHSQDPKTRDQRPTEPVARIETELVQAREAAAAIIDTARDRKSDLILLGMPFRKRLGRVYVGKTVQGVYVGAHCAVLAYRQEETR